MSQENWESGIRVDVRWAATFHMRQGKVGRVDAYGGWARACAALGLAG